MSFGLLFVLAEYIRIQVHELEIFVKCWDCLVGFWTGETCREGLMGLIYRLKYL